MESRVYLLNGIGKSILQRVDEVSLIVRVHVVDAKCSKAIGNILLINHKANEHILVRQFLFEALSIETVEHIVVLYGRM